MSWGVSGLTVRFGDNLALEDVYLDLARGEVTAVVGGDGAGKTTLMRCLTGALAPSTGAVRRPERHRVGYLASTSGTYPDLTVDENLEFFAAVYDMATAEAHERADRYLDRTGLAAARSRLAGQLSGGMRQKLGVIAAMMHRPELLVLDEPTTGIDPVSRAQLWWLIAAAAAGGSAVVLSTTYLDEAERASTLLVLDGGRVLASGDPEAIRASMPGGVRSLRERPFGEAARRAWRRGGRWRIWEPDGLAGEVAPTDVVVPDLQDAVVVMALAQELQLGKRADGLR